LDNPNILYQADFEPRDHGKTELFCISYPLRRICEDPNVRILIVQKTASEAEKTVGVIRTEIESNLDMRAWYRQHWLATVGYDDICNSSGYYEGQSAWRSDLFYCKRTRVGKDPTVEGVGVLGAITGGHYDVIILDDIEDDENTRTEARRQHIIDWFTGTILQLREPHTKVIVVGTFKCASGDLYEYVRSNPLFSTNIESAIVSPALEDISFEPVYNEDGLVVDVKNVQPEVEVLCPKKWSIEQLIMDYLVSGSVMFRREKMNDIGAFKEAIFRRNWLQFYDYLPEVNYKVQVWDTAAKEGEQHSYSVGATWGLGRRGLYVIDVWRQQVEYTDLRAAVIGQFNLHKPDLILVEDASSGQVLVQELRRGTNLPIVPVQTKGRDKLARAQVVTPLMESGLIYLPQGAAWVEAWILEHVDFPNGAHDDQVDTTSMAVAHLKPMLGEGVARGVGLPEQVMQPSRLAALGPSSVRATRSVVAGLRTGPTWEGDDGSRDRF